MKSDYEKYVELNNKAAKANGNSTCLNSERRIERENLNVLI